MAPCLLVNPNSNLDPDSDSDLTPSRNDAMPTCNIFFGHRISCTSCCHLKCLCEWNEWHTLARLSLYINVYTYIFIAHIMRHLIKTMCSTCRLKWKSIFTPFCAPSRSHPVLFCWLLFSELFKCLLLPPLIPQLSPPCSWLYKFIINCFKASSRCLSAFCAGAECRFIQWDIITFCGFPFGFHTIPKSPFCLLYPYDDYRCCSVAAAAAPAAS